MSDKPDIILDKARLGSSKIRFEFELTALNTFLCNKERLNCSYA